MVSKTAEITVRDFRSYMTECYPIIWEIIGVGGREDICSTLESLIECNTPEKQIVFCDTLSISECSKYTLCTDCPGNNDRIKSEKTEANKAIDDLPDEVKEDLFGTTDIKKDGKILIISTPKSDNDIYDELLKDSKKTPEELDELFGESGGYKS